MAKYKFIKAFSTSYNSDTGGGKITVSFKVGNTIEGSADKTTVTTSPDGKMPQQGIGARWLTIPVEYLAPVNTASPNPNPNDFPPQPKHPTGVGENPTTIKLDAFVSILKPAALGGAIGFGIGYFAMPKHKIWFAAGGAVALVWFADRFSKGWNGYSPVETLLGVTIGTKSPPQPKQSATK